MVYEEFDNLIYLVYRDIFLFIRYLYLGIFIVNFKEQLMVFFFFSYLGY